MCFENLSDTTHHQIAFIICIYIYIYIYIKLYSHISTQIFNLFRLTIITSEHHTIAGCFIVVGLSLIGKC